MTKKTEKIDELIKETLFVNRYAILTLAPRYKFANSSTFIPKRNSNQVAVKPLNSSDEPDPGAKLVGFQYLLLS